MDFVFEHIDKSKVETGLLSFILGKINTIYFFIFA